MATSLILTVTNTGDTGAGSLRERLAYAETQFASRLDESAGDYIEIRFASNLNGGTIRLSQRLQTTDGDIRVYGDIDGDGQSDITISGDTDSDGTGDTNILNNVSADLTLDSLVLDKSFADTPGPTGYVYAIANGTGDLTIRNTSISNSVQIGNQSTAATIFAFGGQVTLENTMIEDGYVRADGALFGVLGAVALPTAFIVISNFSVTGTADTSGDTFVGIANQGNVSGGILAIGDGDAGIYASGSGLLNYAGGVGTVTIGISGTNGNDTLTGGGEGTAKLILGLGGDDEITLNGENDTVFGGNGNDQFVIQNGSARLYGDNGNDTFILNQATGNHVINGGAGFNTIGFAENVVSAGQNTNISLQGVGPLQTVPGLILDISNIDSVFATEGNDLVNGNENANLVFARSGSDSVYGFGGDDYLVAEGGTTVVLSGGTDNDVLFVTGAVDNATLEGGTGSDFLGVGTAGVFIVRGSGGEGSADDGEDTISFLGDTGVNFSLQLDGQTQTVRDGLSVSIEQIESANGTTGNDTLTGSTFDGNTIFGFNGNDFIDGLALNNTLFGGAGDDTINGGSGNDSIEGDFGNLDTSTGNDMLLGEAGNDTVGGGSGNDQLFGGIGLDFLKGDDGNDTLQGGDDNDILNGGANDDRLFGDAGIDRLLGGTGNDALFGGSDRGFLFGNAGNDRLIGGTTVDRMLGGTGNDRLVGAGGRDFMFGENGNDFMFGGNGNDVMRSGRGNDRMFGGNGNDNMLGFVGNESLEGGNGNDVIRGAGGNDTIEGGRGNDKLQGGGGRDTFVFADVNFGTDRIQRDFRVGSDKIDFSDHRRVNDLDDLTIREIGSKTIISVDGERSKIIIDNTDDLVGREDDVFLF